jgi:arylsulfatase A
MHAFLTDFLTRHKDQPFFVYYPMSHIHGPIVRTPDSKPDAGKEQLYADNVAYMDKLVGRLMDELDRLHLREKTLVMFIGDNGTARFGQTLSTVDGKAISGMKGSMLEGGSRVPFLASWKGTTPAGRVVTDLVDFSDFFVSLAEVGGAALPAGVALDGHSFVPQLRGEKGTPRSWVYVQLGPRWYVRDAGFKLTRAGDLFDLSNAPFEEKPLASDDPSETSVNERARLQAVLDQLNPASGVTAPVSGKKAKGGKKHKAVKSRLPSDEA